MIFQQWICVYSNAFLYVCRKCILEPMKYTKQQFLNQPHSISCYDMTLFRLCCDGPCMWVFVWPRYDLWHFCGQLPPRVLRNVEISATLPKVITPLCLLFSQNTLNYSWDWKDDEEEIFGEMCQCKYVTFSQGLLRTLICEV
jgi:hypothetical protein